MKILVIEDNPRLSERMKQQLQKWHIVEVAFSGHDGISSVYSDDFDLVLLDLGLPDMPGLDVCKKIRDFSNSIPLFIVTGVDTTVSRVELLNAGADDYIAKPFEPDELIARINALSRRRKRGESRNKIIVGDLTIEPSSRKVSRANVSIVLRRKEFDILEYLASNKGRVMSRQMIVNHAWSTTSATWTGSVDVHIKQLRDKIDRPFEYPMIRTSYGVGYMLDAPEVV